MNLLHERVRYISFWSYLYNVKKNYKKSLLELCIEKKQEEKQSHQLQKSSTTPSLLPNEVYKSESYYKNEMEDLKVMK